MTGLTAYAHDAKYMRIFIQDTTVPPTADIQSSRRDAIRRLLLAAPVPNQQRLVDALTEQGFHATQSSVSRDLKEIGAVKTGSGYELPASDRPADEEVAKVAPLVRELAPAGPHLIVIRTAIGAAQRVALALDRSGWSELVGTVAGDDTIFAATTNAQGQRRMLTRMGQSAARA